MRREGAPQERSDRLNGRGLDDQLACADEPGKRDDGRSRVQAALEGASMRRVNVVERGNPNPMSVIPLQGTRELRADRAAAHKADTKLHPEGRPTSLPSDNWQATVVT